MNNTIVILAGGEGKKMWPYTSIRSKALLPIGNMPLIQRTIEDLVALNVQKILISVSHFVGQFNEIAERYPQVQIIEHKSKGSSDSLRYLEEYLKNQDTFVVIFGDTLYPLEDLKLIVEATSNTVIVDALKEHSNNWIACKLQGNKIVEFGGHFRNEELTHKMVGGVFNSDVFSYTKKNPGYFRNVRVGVGSPHEEFLEETINIMIEDKVVINALLASDGVVDIDKPWHFLDTNANISQLSCNELKVNEIHSTARIHESADIQGVIKLGKNSIIGKNCRIKGNVIIGDDTVIDQGVVLDGNIIIGDQCLITNYVHVASNTVIGNRCKLSQGFELLGGIFFDHVAAVHYGEYYGAIGESSDLGAGTTCGTLRFDDQKQTHVIQGRRETPLSFDTASYLGDFTRTGVGVLLMPGVKVGGNSIIGSGVVLDYDVEDKMMITLKQEHKQEHIKKPWGPNKYGW